ncbi:hypothetical protein BKA82DRAFT_292159 [Pisolithus tinctorius]|uniref:Uncharacterized protein n=1 Tax=Pisolithus tinctorius Marx 270 TaxID=870435 RepID=A0A0C3NL93_PISTI|nr:hypothetical protein BKA82DRAFT_292159 [Pisolithus tinctorius]KIN96083.1 hypothetical protein M404DRAFT_292159 [Pisolithus tinctorius Marx 270]
MSTLYCPLVRPRTHAPNWENANLQRCSCHNTEQSSYLLSLIVDRYNARAKLFRRRRMRRTLTHRRRFNPWAPCKLASLSLFSATHARGFPSMYSDHKCE